MLVCDVVRMKSSSRRVTQRRTIRRFESGKSDAREIQPSSPSANGAIFAIDKRHAADLSSEKIFVAVCERSFTHATEARTASHTAPQWARNRSRVDARSIL
jgi:hypothetical protein